jgi:hypothetical protein
MTDRDVPTDGWGLGAQNRVAHLLTDGKARCGDAADETFSPAGMHAPRCQACVNLDITTH